MHYNQNCLKTNSNYYKYIIDIKSLRIVYLAIIQSIISFGILIWYGTYSCHLSALITTSNSVVKLILCNRRLNPSHFLLSIFSVFAIHKLGFL